MKYLIGVILALNLSSAATGEPIYDPAGIVKQQNLAGRTDNSPFSGAGKLDIVLEREEFATQKEPIPYAAIWNNSLRQTAQQYVAILSVLQSGNEASAVDMIKQARRQLARLREEAFIDRVKEGVRTGRYGMSELPPKYVRDGFWEAMGLAVICLGGLIFLLVDHAWIAHRNVRKFWKERGKSS